MLKNARLKVAESINKIEKPDDWQWKRWLKKPSNSVKGFSISPTKIVWEEYFKTAFVIPVIRLRTTYFGSKGFIERKQFEQWLRVKATKSKNGFFQTPKTNRIFFSLSNIEVSQNLFPREKEITFQYSPASNFLLIDIPTQQIKIVEPVSLTFRLFYYREIENIYFEKSWSFQEQIFINIYQPGKWEFIKEIDFEADKLIEQFFIKPNFVCNNLLPTGKDFKLVNEHIISQFFLYYAEISSNLLPVSSNTYDVSLLNVEKFETNISNLQFSLLSAPSDNINLITNTFVPMGNLVNEIKNISLKEISFVNISKNLSGAIPFNAKIKGLNKLELTKSIKTKNFNFQKLRIPEPQIIEADTKYISTITPVEKMNFHSDSKTFDNLHAFQKEGIDFLINNPFCYLADEHGLGKTVQVINSINFLFNKNRIKNVLVLTKNSEFGILHLPNVSGIPEGWNGHFSNWAPDLKTCIIPEDEPKRKKIWFNQSQIIITSYSVFFNDYQNGIIPKDLLNKIDCVILDEFQDVRAVSLLNKLFKKNKPKYLWILSGLLKEERKVELEINLRELYNDFTGNLIPDFEWNNILSSVKLSRTMDGQTAELPDRIYHNKWFKMCEEQVKEYDAIIQEGELTIYSTIERGNYYIVRPQIFSLLHQLMQICNFASTEFEASKAKEILEFIQSSKDKVVVFSQYEKLGLDRLKKLFTTHNLDFVIYKTGMLEAELEKSVNDFRDNKAQIFLADVKAVQKKINLGNFSTIIHFDHWWNPNSVWQLEDKIDFGNIKKTINIYSYWTENTIEEKIYSKLSEKGLFHKNIFYNFSPSTVAEFISVEEWLVLFDIKAELISEQKVEDTIINVNTEIHKYNQNELREAAKKILVKLGFNNTKILMYDENSKDEVVLGSKMVNNNEQNILVLLTSAQYTNLETINKFLNTFSDQVKISKSFIITFGSFKSDCKKLIGLNQQLLTLIDGTLLLNILQQFSLK